MVHRFAALIISWRWVLLACAAAVAVPGYFAAHKLDYDRSIENMFSPDDPVLQDLKRVERVFGKDQIVLLVYRDQGLFAKNGAGIRRADRISDEVASIHGVADVLSVSVLDRMLRGLRASILDRQDPLARRYHEMFSGYTHSAKGDVAAVVCVLDRQITAQPGELPRVLQRLRAVAAELPGNLGGGVLVGEPVMINDGFRYVELDGRQLGMLSMVLLGITMFVCLRSLRAVLIALVIVAWSTVVTQATLAWGGWQLSMVSSMLSAIITVVGVATVMHLLLGFRDRLKHGMEPQAAFHEAFVQLIGPITWACITDAAGFVALMAADAGPIRDFGLMMTLGSLMVLVAVVVIVPGLALAGGNRRAPSEPAHAKRLERGLAQLMNVVLRRPRKSLAVFATLFVAGFVGMLMMNVETDFTRNFRANSPIATSYEFVEQRLGGAGVWDVMIPAPERLTEEYLERVERFEDALRRIRVPGRNEPALTKVLSLADALQAAEARPLLGMTSPELRSRSMSALLPGFVSTLRAQDPQSHQHYLRVMLRAYDRRDAARKLWLIDRVEAIARAHFRPTRTSTPVVTGSYVLLTNLVAGIVRDQWICLGLALLSVGAAIAVAVRSLQLAVIALLVNTLPVILLLGTAGWVGVRMNMGAAMIGAVSMGLSVDSSLHYLYAFRRAFRRGEAFESALQEAQQTVGRALVYATIALAIGFLSLTASHFIPTVSFGALSALTLIGSLFCNLLALPLLLELGMKRR